MDRLNTPKVGDKITAKWANEIVSQIRRQQLVPGPGYRLKTTSSGTVITFDSKKGGGGGTTVKGLDDAVYIAQCIGTPNEDGSIPVDLYESDLGGPVFRNVTAFRPDLTHFTRMDVGTRFIVHAISIVTNNGGEAL